MSLKIPSVANTQPRMSHIEFFDDEVENLQESAEKTGWKHIYNRIQCGQISQIMGNSTIFIKGIIDEIVQAGGQLLYDRYIESKLNDYAIKKTLKLSEEAQLPQFVEQDVVNIQGELDGLKEDFEPAMISNEHWKRGTIQVQTIQKEVDQTDLQSEASQFKKTHQSSKRGSQTKIKYKMNYGVRNTKQSVKEVPDKNTYNYTIVDRTEAKEFDVIEEQYRTAKEREMKMKQEQEQQLLIRERELREQQSRLRNLPADVKKQSYTYDYDGKILPFSTSKTEKQGFLTNSISHFVPTKPISVELQQKLQDEMQQQMDQKQLGIGSGMGQRDQKYLQDGMKSNDPFAKSKQSILQIGTQNPNIYENFNMNPGVTLIHENNIKTGPKMQCDLDLTNTLNLTNPQTSIRMTRNEYQNLTKGGNLSRTEETSYYAKNKKKKLQPDILEEEFDMSKSYKTVEILNDLNLKSHRPKRNSIKQGKIKGDSKDDTLYRLFTEDITKEKDSGYYDSLNFNSIIHNTQGSISAKNDRYKENDLSIIDHFNMSILKGNSTSRDQGGGKISLPKIQANKPQDSSFRGSLGLARPKMPRSRINKEHLKSISYTKLPPPQVGKIMGHGFDQGYSPQDIDEEIRQKYLHDNSIQNAEYVAASNRGGNGLDQLLNKIQNQSEITLNNNNNQQQNSSRNKKKQNHQQQQSLQVQ